MKFIGEHLSQHGIAIQVKVSLNGNRRSVFSGSRPVIRHGKSGDFQSGIPVSHRIHQGIELAAQLSLYTPFIQIEELDVFQIEV